MLLRAIALLACLALSPSAVSAEATIRFEEVTRGLSQPLFVTHSGDGSGRLFIVEKGGLIRVWADGTLFSEPFLDLSTAVTNASEMGLLGLAFHPGYSGNGRFFVNYTTEEGGPRRTVVAEYQRDSSDPDRADPQSARKILSFEQPARNHNGGMIAFGPDGYLYIAAGDGGGSFDTYGNAQDLSTLPGTILRIDVDRGDPYAVPPDNPFVDTAGAQPEIWAYGLRNPWRFSFDRLTGQLFAGDVGQGTWEEIDLIRKGGNFGWPLMEGNHCVSSDSTCDSDSFIAPIAEYGRSEGNSITGGYVYRGTQETTLWGGYIFGDFGSGAIWALKPVPRGEWERRFLLDSGFSISSFGEAESGEIYVVDFSGGLYRLVFGSQQQFAHFGDGIAPEGRLVSRLLLVNPWDQLVQGEVRLHAADGADRPLTLNGVEGTSFPFEVPPESSVALESAGTSEPAWVGWVEVDSALSLQGLISFSFRSPTGALLSEAGIASSDSGRRFVVPVSHQPGSLVESGLALANPGFEPASISLSLIDDKGASLGFQNLTLEGRRQSAEFVSERFPDLPVGFEGTVVIESSRPVLVTLLRTLSGLPLSSLPAAPSN